MNLNKNISVWRGNDTPPTDYHLWEKEDGSILTKIDEEWKPLVSPEKDITIDTSIKSVTLQTFENSAELDITRNNNTKFSITLESATTETSGLMSVEDKKSLDDLSNTLINTESQGFFIVDESDNIGLKYDQNGLDAAQVSNHFIELVSTEIEDATPEHRGLMSALDKIKLNEVEEKATKDQSLSNDDINKIIY